MVQAAARRRRTWPSVEANENTCRLAWSERAVAAAAAATTAALPCVCVFVSVCAKPLVQASRLEQCVRASVCVSTLVYAHVCV